MTQERMRIACASGTDTFRMKPHVVAAVEADFDVFSVTVDRSQKQVLKLHRPDAIFIDYDPENTEQKGEFTGFMRMLTTHFPDIPVIIRTPVEDSKYRT